MRTILQYYRYTDMCIIYVNIFSLVKLCWKYWKSEKHKKYYEYYTIIVIKIKTNYYYSKFCNNRQKAYLELKK